MNCLFSVDLMLIEARIHTFLKKIPTNNIPFKSFALVQFLLIDVSVKVTYIRNGCLTWVAHSQGRASDDSRAHLVIESGPSIAVSEVILKKKKILGIFFWNLLYIFIQSLKFFVNSIGKERIKVCFRCVRAKWCAEFTRDW